MMIWFFKNLQASGKALEAHFRVNHDFCQMWKYVRVTPREGQYVSLLQHLLYSILVHIISFCISMPESRLFVPAMRHLLHSASTNLLT